MNNFPSISFASKEEEFDHYYRMAWITCKEPDDIVEACTKAINAWTDKLSYGCLIDTYNYRGVYQSDPDKAINDYEKGLEWVEKAMEQPNVKTDRYRNIPSMLWNNIALAYEKKGMTDKAMEYYTLAVESPQCNRKSRFYYSRGGAFLRREDYEVAMNDFYEALEHAIEEDWCLPYEEEYKKEFLDDVKTSLAVVKKKIG